jgi:isopenicillin N synthase-like dioxygenase
MSEVKVVDVRGEMKDDPEALYLMDHPDSTEEIPTLDMAPYLNGAPGGREAVAAHLDEISRTVGFFYLKGHGIPLEVIDRLFDASHRFHSQPEAVKAKIPYFAVDTLKSGYHPGQEVRRSENINIIRDAKPNLYARFAVNREGGWGSGAPDPQRPINIWPESLPGFKEAVLDYHHRIEKLGRQFLPLWATALDLPLDYLDKFFEAPHLTLSLLRYPPQKEVGNRQYGIAPHTDNSMMTFLLQENVSGLAVRMPSGHWRVVDIVPGAILVNTGNLIVRWTNGKYLSTKHRVINTNEVDRYSIPVFFGPSGDALIECLPTCQGPDHPPQYEPVTYRALRQWYYGSYD